MTPRLNTLGLDFTPDGRERGDDDPSIKRDEREAGSIGGGTERSDTLAVDIDDFDSYGAPSDNAELADLVSFGDLADDEPDDAGDDQEPDEHGPSSSYAGADARVTKARLRHKVHRMKRHEIAAELFNQTGLPEPGECLHVLGNGGFNAWEVLVLLIEAAAPVEAYLNTWTMNYSYAVDILRECDAGRIAPCHFLSSQNLSSLRPDVYATLLHGFRRRGYDFACVPTHTKVTLLSNAERGAWYVVETSANYTGNPRLEQYVVTNSRQVHDFHREWMDLIFAAERKRGAT